MRGKVIGFQLEDPHVSLDQKKVALETAKKYFALAAGYVKEEKANG